MPRPLTVPAIRTRLLEYAAAETGLFHRRIGEAFDSQHRKTAFRLIEELLAAGRIFARKDGQVVRYFLTQAQADAAPTPQECITRYTRAKQTLTINAAGDGIVSASRSRHAPRKDRVRADHYGLPVIARYAVHADRREADVCGAADWRLHGRRLCDPEGV